MGNLFLIVLVAGKSKYSASASSRDPDALCCPTAEEQGESKQTREVQFTVCVCGGGGLPHLSSECWHYRCVPMHLVYVVLGWNPGLHAC